MMYKLLHFLFGWDYISWHNTVAYGVARIYKNPNGTVYYWRYKTTQLLDVITQPKQVIWLTCSSDKYFKEAICPDNSK